MVRIRNLFLSALFFFLVGFAGQAEAAKKTPKKPKVPKVVAYWAQIEISGSVGIHSYLDTTSSCAPGQAWTLDEVATVDVKGRAFISVVRRRVAGGLIKNKRAITQASDLADYRTSNYCEGPKAELKKPDCKPRVTGNARAFLQSFPGQKRRVVVFVTRTSGADQDPSCETTPIEVDSLNASIHAFQQKHRQLRLPLKLENIGFHNMKPGWKHRTRINVNGPCEEARITTPESGWVTKQSIAHNGCSVSGSFQVTITRAKPKKAKGKKKAKVKRPKATKAK